nr:hypothetical protein [uncultured Rhodopila sp.]
METAEHIRVDLIAAMRRERDEALSWLEKMRDTHTRAIQERDEALGMLRRSLLLLADTDEAKAMAREIQRKL